MKIVNSKPPLDLLDIEIYKDTIYTVGDVIYNPSGIVLPEDVIRHEMVHCQQQGNDVTKWWNRYKEDKEFRLSQELEAYREQYEFIRRSTDRNYVFSKLVQMSYILSGKIYGNICSFNDAIKWISKSK